jgi:hypothetical protein
MFIQSHRHCLGQPFLCLYIFTNPQNSLIMKKPIIHSIQFLQLLVLCIFFNFYLLSPVDAQINKWSLNGQQIDFTSGNPVVNDLPGSPLQNADG